MLSPLYSCKLHSNYTILIRGTFKSFQFQVVPLFKCRVLSPSACVKKFPLNLSQSVRVFGKDERAQQVADASADANSDASAEL